MSAKLNRLFRPETIAVIGGGVWAESVITQAQKLGFSGKIQPVHPKREYVAGIRAVVSVNDLEDAPDASYVCVNRQATLEVVEQLSQMGAGGAVCFASGYNEASKLDAQAALLSEQLLQAAGDMPLLGPNCYGFINYLDGTALWPDQHGGQLVESGVAIISQSSNVAINLTMQQGGLPIAYVVCTGNQSQLSAADIALDLVVDPRVTALVMYIEGFGDIATWEKLSTVAREINKPIVALKAGLSQAARSATYSHTASLAGSDAGARALTQRLEIVSTDSVGELLQAAKLLHTYGRFSLNSIATLSCSGGEACLIADAAQKYGVEFASLTTEQTARLSSVLGSLVTITNPLDYHTFIWGNVEAMRTTYELMSGDGIDLSIVVIDFPRQDRCDLATWQPAIQALEMAKKNTNAKFAAMSLLPENIPEGIAQKLLANSITPLSGVDHVMAALAAIRKAYSATQPVERYLRDAPLEANGEGFDKSVKSGKSAPKLKPLPLWNCPIHCEISTTSISETEAKESLAEFGLTVPAGGMAASETQAVALAEELGFPVAIKGHGLSHKSDSGSVALNINSPEEVIEAVRSISTSSVRIEQMAGGGVELLVGVIRDEPHGWLLTLGAGGIFTELMRDRQCLLLPVTEQDIRQAFSRLRISVFFDGFRGQAAVSLEAAVAAVMCIQRYAQAHRSTLSELEINPLLVTADRAIALDALIQTIND